MLDHPSTGRVAAPKSLAAIGVKRFEPGAIFAPLITAVHFLVSGLFPDAEAGLRMSCLQRR
jgi:hypothetical protein